ncbi:hypothetical protein [Cupriavidus basilensis]
MGDNNLKVIQADQFYNQITDLSPYQFQLLAQGDSWFSMSTANIPASSNMLLNMTFTKMAVAIDCAYPGRTLKQMAELPKIADWRQSPYFRGLLFGPREQWWSALLLSGGGNDMIDALQVLPGDEHSTTLCVDRLLRMPDEWGAQSDVTKYIMEDGWMKFVQYLISHYCAIDQARLASKYNKDVPIITHLYDYATPRNSGAGLGVGPWLYKAVQSYHIPVEDWKALSTEFMRRLAGVICALDKNPPQQASTLPPPPIAITPLDNFHVVWTLGTLSPADTTDTGPTQDWYNEIHPTKAGYQELANLMVPVIESVCNSRHALANNLLTMSTKAAPARNLLRKTTAAKRKVA